MEWIGSRVSGHQLEYSYVWRTLMEQSVLAADGSSRSCLRVAGGSDAPIEVPNPFTGRAYTVELAYKAHLMMILHLY